MVFLFVILFKYVLYICPTQLKDRLLYTDFTPNLKSRIKSHESGYVTATKHRRLFTLFHYGAFVIESDAKRREQYLKGGNGKKKLEKILEDYFKQNPWKK